VGALVNASTACRSFQTAAATVTDDRCFRPAACGLAAHMHRPPRTSPYPLRAQRRTVSFHYSSFPLRSISQQPARPPMLSAPRAFPPPAAVVTERHRRRQVCPVLKLLSRRTRRHSTARSIPCKLLPRDGHRFKPPTVPSA
jgi:hypothetical protein